MAPLSLETDLKTKVRILSKVIERKRRLIST